VAAKGNKDAQRNLGVLYETGSGVEQDLKAAAAWFAKVAASGQPDTPARRDACLARIAAASRR
jgi:TPR repeat protein